MSWYAGISAHGNVALWDSEGGLREVTDVHADRDDPVVRRPRPRAGEAMARGRAGWARGVRRPDSRRQRLVLLGTAYDLPHGRIRALRSRPRLRPAPLLRCLS